MDVKHFNRKSFPVDGVQVTLEDMAEIARWCDGEIHEDHSANNPSPYPAYIKVRVHNPLTERQTMAYVGDWVLYAGKGYKVYTARGLKKSFDEQEQNDSDPGAEELLNNIFSEQGAGSPSLGHGRSGGKNPGGTSRR